MKLGGLRKGPHVQPKGFTAGIIDIRIHTYYVCMYIGSYVC